MEITKPETYLEVTTNPDDLDRILNLEHIFSPGLYLREITIPKNKIIIGHHHKQQHLNIFLQGKMILFSTDGSRKVVTAPMVFTGNPGRKMAFAIEESKWMNVYATDETDINKLELAYIDKDAPWPEGLALLKQILDGNSVKKIIQGEKLCLGEQ